MEQNTEQNQDDVLKRLAAVKPVDPSPFLWAKIYHRIEARKKANEFITPRLMWRMAAVFVLLLMVNVFVLIVNPEDATQETALVAEELGLISDNYYDNY